MQQKEEKPTQVWAKNSESNLEEAQVRASNKEQAETDEQLTNPTVSPASPEPNVEEQTESASKPVEVETGGSGEDPNPSKGPNTGDPESPTDWEDQLDHDRGMGAAPSPSLPGSEDGEGEEDPDVTPKDSVQSEDYPKPTGVLKWKKGDSGEGVKTEPEPDEKRTKEESSLGEPDVPVADQDSEEVSETEGKKKFTKKVLMYTFIWFPLLLVAALAGGLLIGYSVIGDDPAGEVFTRELWEHLYNLIYG